MLVPAVGVHCPTVAQPGWVQATLPSLPLMSSTSESVESSAGSGCCWGRLLGRSWRWLAALAEADSSTSTDDSGPSASGSGGSPNLRFRPLSLAFGCKVELDLEDARSLSSESGDRW